MNAAVVRGLEAVAAAGADGAPRRHRRPAARPPGGPRRRRHRRPARPVGDGRPLLGRHRHQRHAAPPAGGAHPRLGVDSLARHLAQAARRGVPVTRVNVPALALDIDTPRDLAELMARGGGGATLDACARLEIAGLLAAGSAH